MTEGWKARPSLGKEEQMVFLGRGRSKRQRSDAAERFNRLRTGWTLWL